ncbi:GNAT family N-acetyltransferase [Pseudomonas sp. Eth.TT006]
MRGEVTLRRYRDADGAAVSGLFQTIYGEHYPQPQVYLPHMISQNQTNGHWHSLVAIIEERLCGHASLFRQAGQASLAELALTVVHPQVRGQNIATRLSQQLLEHAQALDCRGVTIKQVTHHLYTQRMAAGLGFHNCGLLPDYVPCPFGGPNRETLIIGHRGITEHRRPLPRLPWPQPHRALMVHLEAVFGSVEKAPPWREPKVRFEQVTGRYDMVLKALDDNLLEQLKQLPTHWLISLRLRLAEGFDRAAHALAAMGFAFTGITPDERSEGWLALFHRGYQPSTQTLHCPHMQHLQEQAVAFAENYRGRK